MKEYKRLSKRDEEFGIIALCPACSRKATCEKQEECVDCLNEMQERLAELEDKIENGTLIELPCKVGDKVYRLWTYSNGGYIQDYTIVKIEIYEEKILWFDDSDNQIEIADFGETVFLTKAEAEAKLKEQQNER